MLYQILKAVFFEMGRWMLGTYIALIALKYTKNQNFFIIGSNQSSKREMFVPNMLVQFNSFFGEAS